MKLALFSILVLALSTLRSVAMPSIIPEDAKVEDHQSNELSILDIDANELSIRNVDVLGPWGMLLAGVAIGTIVSAVVAVPLGIGIGLAVNKIQKWLDSPGQNDDISQPVLAIKAENGEDYKTLAINFARLLSEKLAPDVGILVAEKEAIKDVQVPRYDWLPLLLQTSPDAPSSFLPFDIFVSRFPGYVQVYTNNPNGGGAYTAQTGGRLVLQSDYNAQYQFWTYSFGT